MRKLARPAARLTRERLTPFVLYFPQSLEWSSGVCRSAIPLMDTPFPSRSAAARGEEEELLELLVELDLLEDELELLEDELSFDRLRREEDVQEDVLSLLELLEDELSSDLMLSSDLIPFTSHLTSLGIFTWEQGHDRERNCSLH